MRYGRAGPPPGGPRRVRLPSRHAQHGSVDRRRPHVCLSRRGRQDLWKPIRRPHPFSSRWGRQPSLTLGLRHPRASFGWQASCTRRLFAHPRPTPPSGELRPAGQLHAKVVRRSRDAAKVDHLHNFSPIAVPATRSCLPERRICRDVRAHSAISAPRALPALDRTLQKARP